MSLKISNVTSSVSGFAITLGLIITMVLPFVQSGDSTTPKQKNTTHQLIQKQWVM